jgi:predicted  nucleic acid-binding Zn-ribbon protein
MSGSDDTYLRCTHCKGFYETSFPRCKWCEYDAPLLTNIGRPRVFPTRDACRALQIAEYDRLPPEAFADPMGPPKDELTLLCNCLHCGPDGHTFEAIEMRWMLTERMWACPCTTCGGRGFGIDIHSAENKWRCADCGHFYVPANRDYRAENAKCPKCGSTEASGWFDDPEYDEDDDDGGANATADHPTARELSVDEDLPWDDDDDEDDDDDDRSPYDLGITWKESDAPDNFHAGYDSDEDDANPYAGPNRLPDDIDFPHHRDDRSTDINEDDIPF